MDDDEDTVVVEDIAELLDSAQKMELTELLSSLPSNNSQQGMLSQYVLTKRYVSQALM